MRALLSLSGQVEEVRVEDSSNVEASGPKELRFQSTSIQVFVYPCRMRTLQMQQNLLLKLWRRRCRKASGWLTVQMALALINYKAKVTKQEERRTQSTFLYKNCHGIKVWNSGLFAGLSTALSLDWPVAYIRESCYAARGPQSCRPGATCQASR